MGGLSMQVLTHICSLVTNFADSVVTMLCKARCQEDAAAHERPLHAGADPFSPLLAGIDIPAV